MTPYNYGASVGRALDADATTLLDPGAGGVVTVSPKGTSVLVLRTAGTRTFQGANGVSLAAQVIVFATASVTIQGIALSAGEYTIFRVTLDSAGVRQWAVQETSEPPLADAVLAPVALTAGLVPVASDDRELEDPTPTATGVVNISTYADAEAVFKIVLQKLDEVGLITDQTTT